MLATQLRHVRSQDSTVPITQRHQIFVSRGSPQVTVIIRGSRVFVNASTSRTPVDQSRRVALSESASHFAIGMWCARLELMSLARLARDKGNEYAEAIVENSKN